jgi:small subunit ribosomal protein S8
MVSDPIADFLIRIKNAYAAGRPSLTVQRTRLNFEIAKIFEKEGLVAKVTQEEKMNRNFLVIELKYRGKLPMISVVKRISKPGRRIYAKVGQIPWVKYGRGLTLVSTSGGIMSDREARKKNLGGEVIGQLW